ncbi:MAG: acetyl-CoA carboxylase biotin carboxyl carrier protein subunit [Proteobacteria bacterium]|nr:acetyl-CoA carboxylase biotin carboxyl carrier protein subunit [Pseudomonadota bacterium]
MELNELQQLIAKLEASGLRSLELSRPGERVKLTMSDNSEVQVVNADDTVELFAAPASLQAAPAGTTVLTEAAGLFLATHPMRSKPLAEVGQSVKKNDVLGLLKIGPVYAPVTAPADGVVTQILASDGALLGFGAPVLEIAASA